MNKKIERELAGPSWTEVILGAVLSLILGVALGAAYLVLKPVETVRELPKEPVADMVYFISGSRDASRARQAEAKQAAFLRGGSVVLSEDELNVLVAPGAEAKPAAPAGGSTLTPGVPNFRIRDSVMQVAGPVRLSVLGLEDEIVVQARGVFEKRNDVFVFSPTEIYVGSCPVQRLPGVQGLLFGRVLAAVVAPAELVAAWRRVSDAAVEGSTLRLTVP